MKLVGRLSAKKSLTGSISIGQTLRGMLSGKSSLIGKLTIPQILGTMYEGQYVVDPLAKENVVLDTKEKFMANDVVVNKVPYFETSNEKGTTVYIAEV